MPISGMQHYNLHLNKIIDYAARWHPEQEVVTKTVETGSISVSTYAEVHRRSQCCAIALETLGVRKGDVVATLAWNTVRHVECWYGIIGQGAICHTLNPRLSDNDLVYIANDAEDTIIMCDAPFAGLMERIIPKIRKVRAVVFLTDREFMPTVKLPPGVQVLCYEELIIAASPYTPHKWVDVPEDHPCGMCYTSGTTGRPKGVVYSHRSNFLHAMAASTPDSVPMSSHSTVLAVVPMFHANSWGLVFSAPMSGSRLVLPGPHLSGESLHNLMETQRVTITAGVPTVWMQLLNYMNEKKLSFSTLKYVCIGGAAAPRALVEALVVKYKVNVHHLWGMTEVSPLGTIGGIKKSVITDAEALAAAGSPDKAQDLILNSHTSQGRPHIFADLRIVSDPDTEGRVREIPRDGKSVGLLQIRGPHTIRGYHKKVSSGPGLITTPSGAAGGLLNAVDEEDWFGTGDMATIDAYGHMRITDRSKDVIKSGGEWISSVDIENNAVGFPGVQEAAAVAIPDPHWGERPLLVVALHKDVVPGDGLKKTPAGDSAEERAAAEFETKLLEYLGTKLAKFATPDAVEFIKEIPHNATGKISKLELREMFKGYVMRPRKGKNGKAPDSKL